MESPLNPDLDRGESHRAHLRALVAIACPLAISQVAEMAMGTTDTALLGGIGPDAVAIGGLATNLFFTTLATFQSGLGSAGILMSRALGAGRAQDVPGIGVNGLIFASLLSLPCIILLALGHPILRLLGEPAILVEQSSRFMLILLLAVPPDLLVIGLMRTVLPAIGAQHLMLWTMPAMAVVNGIMNAGFIHGGLGLPGMGLWGSAAATTATGWLVAGALLLLVRRHPRTRPHLRWSQPDFAVMREMLVLGLPIMASVAGEVVMFQITSLRAGLFGPASVAAHQIALTVSATTFMVSLALSQAVNVRVAFWLGANRPDQARRAIVVAIGLVLVWTILCAVGLHVGAGSVARLYLGAASAPAIAVGLTAASLLRIAGLFQIVDGLQALFGGALRGAGDTFVPMLMTTLGFIVLGSLAGTIFGVWHRMGVQGLWVGLLVGLASVSLMLGVRLWIVVRRMTA